MNEGLDKLPSLTLDTFKYFGNGKIIESIKKSQESEFYHESLLALLSEESLNSNKQLLERLLDREMLVEILESIPQGVQIVDRDGIIVYVNVAFLDIVNVEANERIGKSIFEVSYDGSLSTVLRTKKSVSNLMNFPKGTSVELVSNASPIFYEGEMIGAVAAVNDVKDVMDLTEQLKKSKYMVKNLSEKITHLSTAKYTFDDIIANGLKMQSVLEMCQVAAQSDSVVLIQGETGTGKELIAHAIHNASARAQQPFITVNCSAIPKNLLESEFFGHEKGAFTGAYKRKLGKFELANKGTLFLDEIGEMDLELQPKILRAIQEKEIQRVGSEDRIQVDVRIISATNRNLIQMIHKGEFRRDLYYRLNVWNINIPPLRERREDLGHLINFLTQKTCRRLGKKYASFCSDAMTIMYQYNWPGNIRELENVIERAIIGLRNRDTVEMKDVEYLITNENKQEMAA
ncbi:sigma 54-interacting transcriptional regulator [Clostridiaceae bacterium 35-E11]